MKKVFLTLGLIVLVGAGAAVYFLTYRLDSLIESRMERAATLAMGSHVEVGGVHTDIGDGSLSVREISVANPPGFENPHAAKFTGVEAAVDYATLEIKRVIIDHPEFVIEERDGQTNFGRMLEAIEANAPTGDAAGAPEPEIVIRHFRIDQTRAVFESHSFDRFTDVEVDAIEMHNLRGTPTQLAEQIAREVVGELSSEASSALLKAEARKKLGDVEEKVSSKLRGPLGEDDDEDGEPN
jgi:hypothetical protein